MFSGWDFLTGVTSMKTIVAFTAASSVLALCAANAGEIVGRVTDAGGTVPLRSATVTLEATGQTVSTARDGRYRFANVDAGSYTLVVSYIGSPTVTVEVDVEEGVSTADVALGSTDNIVVIGQRGSLNAALNQQRAADGIITVLSADAIGQLPDENVAEAARRALGVSIANDQGEGRFISVRGINSNLNSTSVNGVRLTSPEAGDRRVGLDVIDADILKNIVISKTLSADKDGDAIGASVELETISGLDSDDMLVKLKVGTIYSELTEDYGPKVSGIFANNYMDGRLGVALSGSFQNRAFASENKEVDGGWETDAAVPYPGEELEFRNYDVERERLSLAANIDYMASDNTRLYLHTLFNEFSDQEYRSRVELKVEDALAEDINGDIPGLSIDGNTVSYAAGIDFVDEDGENATTEIEVDRDIKDRLEEQTVFSIVTGFEHTNGAWTVDASLAYTDATEEEPNRIDANFDQTFDEAGQVLSVDVSDLVQPQAVFAGAFETAYLDASGYELDKIESTNGKAGDEEVAFTLNAKRDVEFGANPGFLKSGIKVRLRDKSYDLDFLEYGYEGDGDVLADFARAVDYPLGVFGPAANPSLVRTFFNANSDNAAVLELDETASALDSLASSYQAGEDVLAAYVMGQIDISNLRVTAGVRVEQTDMDALANVFDEEAGVATAVSIEDDYTDVLPSIAARYLVGDKVIVRAAYYASIFRPNFAQFVPAGVFEDRDLASDEFGNLEAGNPDLERTEAHNFDLLVEYYPTDASILQGGVFFKDLKNLITSATFEDGTYLDLQYDELSTFVNLDEAEVFGIEIGYQQALDFLPAPWDGVIVGANYTYADSEATLPNGDKIEVPGQSKDIFNAILGYDKGRWDLRAAYSYKGENVDDVDVDGIGEGRLILEQGFLDLSAKFEVKDGLKVYADLKNVLDTPIEIVDREDGYDLLNQYEEYGFTAQAGVIWKF